MNCTCHGSPSYWQKDKRNKNGGWWECAVKRRERQRRLHADPERKEAKNRQRREDYWPRPNGGYVKRRRQELASQRERILEQLDQLEREAREC